MTVQARFTQALPADIYVVYRAGSGELLINEHWWDQTRVIERVHTLESLWRRFETLSEWTPDGISSAEPVEPASSVGTRSALDAPSWPLAFERTLTAAGAERGLPA